VQVLGEQGVRPVRVGLGELLGDRSDDLEPVGGPVDPGPA
jgi:hypothetical protein